MLADAAAAALFTAASHPLMLADAAAATLFTPAPLPLMLADAAAATVLTSASLPLMLADAAAATVLTFAPLSLVFAQIRGLAGLLGCSRMQLRSRGLARCARCAGSLLVFVALIALPLVLLVLIKSSLHAQSIRLSAIRMAQHRQLHTLQSTRCLLSPRKEALDANVSSLVHSDRWMRERKV